eukprot:11665119-Alexandrium_andersonii.AAC.1
MSRRKGCIGRTEAEHTHASPTPTWIGESIAEIPRVWKGALAWLGVLWKIKQGCWYPSDETEREAGRE